ncbi:MAG: hypothetical protein JRN21_03650 [Nitrososphaerota archaeon]|nr:hypothetical protein [Nitrososphaerota archaeon]
MHESRYSREGVSVSEDRGSPRTKQTLKSVREIIEKAQESTERALHRAAPVVQKSLGASVDAANKAFMKSMKTIDGATAGDQARLLKAYRKVLSGQAEFVDSRIRALEEKGRKPAA